MYLASTCMHTRALTHLYPVEEELDVPRDEEREVGVYVPHEKGVCAAPADDLEITRLAVGVNVANTEGLEAVHEASSGVPLLHDPVVEPLLTGG
jgi:hypothetical protein